jgi:rhodanese-related sulfurtransferase
MHKKYVALVGASALTLTLGLSGCSSDSEPTAAAATNPTSVQGPGVPDQSATIAKPEAPVRVGVDEFANIIAVPGVVILDVRTPQEFAEGHIEGAVNIPVESAEFIDQVAQLDPSVTYAVYCRSGNRSQPAVDGMASVGVTGVYELDSGTIGWTNAGQPLVS